MNKKITKLLLAVCLTFCLIFPIMVSACGSDKQNWTLSPMLALTFAKKNTSVYNGKLNVVDNNDYGSANRGKVVVSFPEEGLPTAATLSETQLLANGALKMTANFAYNGNETYHIRFTAAVAKVNADGHGATVVSSRVQNILILYKDTDNVWWNIRRSAFGGEFTGGETVSGYSDDDGKPVTVYCFTINKKNAASFSQDFYIIGLEVGEYVITYTAEMADDHGHFHAFEVLASVSTTITIG